MRLPAQAGASSLKRQPSLQRQNQRESAWTGLSSLRASARFAIFGSSAQQAASKHGLQVTASVRYQVNDDLAACDTIDHAVRLEKGLTVFLDSKAE